MLLLSIAKGSISYSLQLMSLNEIYIFSLILDTWLIILHTYFNIYIKHIFSNLSLERVWGERTGGGKVQFYRLQMETVYMVYTIIISIKTYE